MLDFFSVNPDLIFVTLWLLISDEALSKDDVELIWRNSVNNVDKTKYKNNL